MHQFDTGRRHTHTEHLKLGDQAAWSHRRFGSRRTSPPSCSCPRGKPPRFRLARIPCDRAWRANYHGTLAIVGGDCWHGIAINEARSPFRASPRQGGDADSSSQACDRYLTCPVPILRTLFPWCELIVISPRSLRCGEDPSGGRTARVLSVHGTKGTALPALVWFLRRA